MKTALIIVAVTLRIFIAIVSAVGAYYAYKENKMKDLIVNLFIILLALQA